MQALGLAVILCGAWTVAAGLLLYALRLPMGSSDHSIGVLHIVRAAGLAFSLMLSLAFALQRRLPAWATGFLPLATAAVLAKLGSSFSLLADIALLTGTAVLTIWALRCLRVERRAAWVAAALGLVFGLAHAATLVRTGYDHPLAFELALVGVQHYDTLFHAAIAGFLDRYGIASIGLDGLVPLSYHVLSHRLIGAFSGWSGLAPISAYSLFVPVVGAPVLTFCLLATVSPAAQGTSSPGSPIVAVGTLALLMAVLGFTGFWSAWVSESYLVSLWLMLLGIIVMARAENPSGLPDAGTCIMLALLVGLTSMSKISTGAILASGVSLWFVAGRPFTFLRLVAAGLIGCAPFLAIYIGSFSNSSFGSDGIFGIFSYYGLYPKIFLAHSILSATVLYLTYRNLPALAQKERAFSLAILGMTLAALLCGILLKLPSGATTYFAEPGMWAALALLGWQGSLAAWLQKRAGVFGGAIVLGLVTLLVAVNGNIPKASSAYFRNVATLNEAARGGGTSGLLQHTLFGRIVAAADAAPSVDGVAVDAGAEAFWSGHKFCWASSLVVQATTAKPLLRGMHPVENSCQLTKFYGWLDYNRAQSQATAMNEAELCSHARLTGMQTLLRVEASGSLSRLNCAP